MPLNLPDGDACFVDANIFYYHFVETTPYSDECTGLLKRAAQGAVTAFSSVHVMAEAMHKIMVTEAAAHFSLARPSLVNWLRANRHRIGELPQFRRMVEELCSMPIICLTVVPESLVQAAAIAQELSLLTNDAISIALMRGRGLTHLITNDDDFDGVPGLTVWKPR
jgi:predicted nucleic acid-binding protein